jgi:hypothetical protein
MLMLMLMLMLHHLSATGHPAAEVLPWEDYCERTSVDEHPGCEVIASDWYESGSVLQLLLDEPTNHLDLEAIDSLADAINRFNGGLVLVSHDFRLIDQVAKEIWICDHKKVLHPPKSISVSCSIAADFYVSPFPSKQEPIWKGSFHNLSIDWPRLY